MAQNPQHIPSKCQATAKVLESNATWSYTARIKQWQLQSISKLVLVRDPLKGPALVLGQTKSEPFSSISDCISDLYICAYMHIFIPIWLRRGSVHVSCRRCCPWIVSTCCRGRSVSAISIFPLIFPKQGWNLIWKQGHVLLCGTLGKETQRVGITLWLCQAGVTNGENKRCLNLPTSWQWSISTKISELKFLCTIWRGCFYWLIHTTYLIQCACVPPIGCSPPWIIPGMGLVPYLFSGHPNGIRLHMRHKHLLLVDNI